MARIIDADALKKKYEPYESFDGFPMDGLFFILDNAPTIDPVKHGYVPTGVLDQIRWERDIAMSYLEEAGVAFGEKAELQRVKHGKWEIKENEYGDEYMQCTNCKEEYSNGFGAMIGDLAKLTKFCPNCGARMDGE